MKRIQLLTILLGVWLSPTLGNTPETRKINPPKLETTNLGKKILCHRPMRQGAPNMNIEHRDGKIIAHNYGHGGSGWTLGPGCANYVNDMFIKTGETAGLQKDTPITIVGAGALGLFTAYDLYSKGYVNITIVAERFDDLTSHKAGGLLAPVSMNNSPKMQSLIDQIGIDAYKFYAGIAQKKHKDFSEGAVIVPAYFESREASGLEPYVGKVMQPAKDVILDFGNGTTRSMVCYDDGIFIDTAKMMAGLSAYLKSRNVKFVQRKVTNLSEIAGGFVINCSGLGASHLNNDAAMLSVQGHLIMLKNQKPADLNYMILVYFEDGKTKSGQKIKRSFYLFPKHVPTSAPHEMGVIGGTFIEGATEDTPNEEEFDIMIEAAKKFLGIKP